MSRFVISGFVLGLSFASLFACSEGDDSTDDGSGGTRPVVGSGGGSVDGNEGGAGGDSQLPDGVQCEPRVGACSYMNCRVPNAGANHVAACSEVSYATNPPTSGTHYEMWADFRVYDEPVPWGFLVHSLEHSAVILAYNCERAAEVGIDCDELSSALADFREDWPQDSLCNETRNRVMVVPDPELDAPFAAVAWEHYMKGDCFDPELVSDFIEAHYGQTYENICIPGVDPSSYDCGQ